MKKLSLLFILTLVFCAIVSAQKCELNIIPQPKFAKCERGNFKLNSSTKLVVTSDDSKKTANLLNEYLLKTYGFNLKIVENTNKNPKNVILFSDVAPLVYQSEEGYAITINSKIIEIRAGRSQGFFYGLQTFLQLLPIDSKQKIEIPAISIFDAPRFPYRGMHLDVSRHFMPVEFVKKYIDLMSQYKFNQFHWHLTDDQGWRIEIKKYPRLTEIGSKRKESHEGRYSTTFKGDGVPVEGFYTQEEIKDVVAYAKARHINVIPEIEMPGHASAALAAYPDLGKGCKENYEYKVQQTWGIFKEVFCPTDATFKFLEDVLDETIALFPDSPYIHIGGDEVLKDFWKESAFVQELMKRENLKDEHEVQSYFIRRIERFVNSKGKKIIGWDEILEGGIAPNATIMSWRGEKGGIEAAKAKHDVIMTPTDFMYFDYGQGDPQFEPLNIGGFVPLEKVYSYNPHPKELTEDEKKYVLGAQANIWTEYLEKPENVEYMAFPRMLALAEVVWSPLESKNYADFQKRLGNHFPRLDKQNVNYRIPEPLGLKNVVIEDKRNNISTSEMLNPLNKNWRIIYWLYDIEPSEKSTLLEKPVVKPIGWGQKFNLQTIVINEKGRKSSIYVATIWRRDWLKSVENFQSSTIGVKFNFYKGEFKSVKDFENLTPTKTGEMRNLGLRDLGEKENFGVIFEGYLNIPKDEIYEFWVESKDGAVLQIGDETVVDLDGIHPKKNTSGDVPLRAGFHRVRLKFFQTTGELSLNIRFGIKHQPSRGLGGLLFY